MSQRESTNQKLDRLERELLKAGRMSDAEIERIAAAPHLFASVQAGISAEKRRRSEKAFSSRLIWNWRSAGAALAVLTALVLVSSMIFAPKKREIAAAPEKTAAADKASNSREIEQTSAFVTNPPDLPEDVGLDNPLPDERPTPEKISFKSGAPKKAKPKPNRSPRATNVKFEAEGVFYALPFAANAENDDLRIVRAELSPKSLFALGVNVAVENEATKIKTDLLVGSDGVARAIRFVK